MALVVKNPPANAGDVREEGWIPGLGRSPEGGNGNPLQYSWASLSIVKGSDSKESICNVGDLCSIPGLGRAPGEGNDYPLLVFLPEKMP